MRRRSLLIPGVLLLGGWLAAAEDAPREVAPEPRVARPGVSYRRDVAPILHRTRPADHVLDR